MRGSTKWLWQRISALALVPLSYWFVILFLNFLHGTQDQQLDLLSSSLTRILIIIFFLIAIFHARLGIKTIYEDYFTTSQVKIYSLITDIVLFLTLIAVVPVLFI
jgi:succinate dehydrogenase / fumarate reductase membrane anchor subunit